MATQNVVTVRSGTGFTIDVALCNLLPDVAIKDIFILHNGVPYTNLVDYTKLSQTVIQYTGTSLGSTTIQVRRLTPEASLLVDKPGFLQRLSSTLYKSQQDRWLRRVEEANLNGIGPGSTVTVALPNDAAFTSAWNGDVTFPPTRNAVYDEMITRAPKDSPLFTGVPLVPTALDATNNTQIASTAFVHTRVTNALSGSPALGGNPTATTQAATDDSTRVASTAHVKDWHDTRCEVVAYRQGQTSVPINVDVNFTSMTEVVDTLSAFSSDATRSRFTAPATGTYKISASVWAGSGAANCTTYIAYKLNGGASVYAFSTSAGTGSGTVNCAGTWAMPLTLNDTLDFLTFLQVAAGTGTISYSVVIERSQ